ERVKGILPERALEEIEKRVDFDELASGEMFVERAGALSGFFFDNIQTVIGNLTSFLINLGIMIFALFFFFRDGRKFYEEINFLIPMTHEQKRRIFQRFYDTLTATVLGIIATAGTQGLLVGLIFGLLGISFPVLAGVLTFVLSLLPVGGSAIVWLPVGIYLLFTGSIVKGLLLIILGALVVGSIDNIMRPLIIGQRTRLNELFLLLSILGGINVFGFSGLILGPVILAIFISFIEIYKVEYREAKPESLRRNLQE
ncbi:MAG TPA: AI-2E family transporter, partial [Thermodesulfobacteriota bacterium]|nr:AI-2E family transporter [Thermodesulfobacteriota bacterium]